MQKGKIVIISGPSGSGKTTLSNRILSSPIFQKKLVKSISMTTRLPRPGEKDGRDYLFASGKQFLYKERAGHLLEWQKVFDNYYGTPKKNVLELLSRGINVLLCIDVKGARVVHAMYKDAIMIFIKVPSLAILRKRLQGRASEGRKDLALRLKIAKEELAEAKRYDYVVVNDDLDRAYQKLEHILSSRLNIGTKKSTH